MSEALEAPVQIIASLEQSEAGLWCFGNESFGNGSIFSTQNAPLPASQKSWTGERAFNLLGVRNEQKVHI